MQRNIIITAVLIQFYVYCIWHSARIWVVSFIHSIINIKYMPQSKKRPHHHLDNPPPHKASAKTNHRIIYVAVIFFALLGTGIGYFAAGVNTGLIFGGIAGGIAGYFFGYQIDKSITKNNSGK